MNETKILIVDDDEVLLRMIEKNLLSAGYSVAKATNGKDALTIAREWRPHLIVLDIVMPGIDGGETAEILSQDPRTTDIPIIYLTSLLSKNEESRLMISKGRRFLAKPYNPDDLLDEIKKFL